MKKMFAEMLYNLADRINDSGTNMSLKEINNVLDQGSTIMACANTCLDSNLVKDEVSIVASEILKEV